MVLDPWCIGCYLLPRGEEHWLHHQRVRPLNNCPVEVLILRLVLMLRPAVCCSRQLLGSHGVWGSYGTRMHALARGIWYSSTQGVAANAQRGLLQKGPREAPRAKL